MRASRLFVANRISNDVAVLDAHTGEEEKRLLAGRGASYLSLSPDGSRVYATHVIRMIRCAHPAEIAAPESEITVIDAARAVVTDRIPLHAIADVFHLAFSADGRLGAAANFTQRIWFRLRTLNTVAHSPTRLRSSAPMWASRSKFHSTNWIAMPRARLAWSIAPDKSRLFVTAAGSEMRAGHRRPAAAALHSQHRVQLGPSRRILSASANYVVARIPVGHDPRGLALSPMAAASCRESA